MIGYCNSRCNPQPREITKKLEKDLLARKSTKSPSARNVIRALVDAREKSSATRNLTFSDPTLPSPVWLSSSRHNINATRACKLKQLALYMHHKVKAKM